ncbi:MAG: helix-turn-helix domain-containing protein [Sedimentisphaerales bacterium]|nr:helix-turn-helix domain-containing protein [Sedimentisphaerales bacterium]
MKNIDVNATIGRIVELRTSFSGPRGKSEFARALGISPSTYSYYEQDRIPPVETLLNICELTGADLYWLLTGKSQTQKDKSQAEGGYSKVLNEVRLLLEEHPETGDALEAFVELLREKCASETKAITTKSKSERDRGWIPVLGRTAAGIVHCWGQELMPEPSQAVTELDSLVKKHTGKDIISANEAPVTVDLQIENLTANLSREQVNLVRVKGEQQNEIFEFIDCRQICEAFGDSFALHIDGDSMSPRINDGDIVIVSPSVPASNGQIAIAKIRDQIGVTCKLIRCTEQAVHLIPINEKYETKIAGKDELLWALAVLCHISLH